MPRWVGITAALKKVVVSRVNVRLGRFRGLEGWSCGKERRECGHDRAGTHSVVFGV